MKAMGRNQRNNYNEIVLLSSFRGVKNTVEPIAKRLMLNKYKVDDWNVIYSITLGSPRGPSWTKISKYLINNDQIEFDKFLELYKKTRDLRFEEFLDMTDSSKSSGLELLIFYKNLVLWEPRFIEKGRRENHNNYEKIKRLIKNNPNINLTSLGVTFNNKNYTTAYTDKLID